MASVRMLPAAMLTLVAWPVLAQAQVASCQVKSASTALVLMVCPKGATSQDWRAAGQQACGSRENCNAWIWDAAANVPPMAPASDAELPKDRTAKAVAIWVQQGQTLVTLKSAGQ